MVLALFAVPAIALAQGTPAPVPAFEQISPTSILGPDFATYQRFGDCVVAAMPDAADDAVLNTSTDQRLWDRFGRAMLQACSEFLPSAQFYREHPRDSSPVVRPYLAEALVRLHFAGHGPLDFSTVADLQHPSLRPPVDAGHHAEIRDSAERVAAAQNFLSQFGECIARRNPEAVRNLLQTRAGSTDERRLFVPLQSEFAPCLNNGVTLTLTLGYVREGLATNYYKLARYAQAAE